jgi:hypothetical protein
MNADADRAVKKAAYINNLPWVRKHRVSAIKCGVDQIFAAQAWKGGQYAFNLLDEGGFVYGGDPIAPQKERACRALLAREDWALNGPPDAPPFPVSYGERESLKVGGLPHIVAWFARSLEGRHYNLREHPTFEPYARGVMVSEFAPDFIKNDEQLRRRFPPQVLNGLGPGLCWSPPTVQ